MPATVTSIKPPPKVDFSEIGRSGLRRFGGTVQEEFLTVLQGQRGIRVYREMRDNDAIIGAVMYAMEQVIRKASWFIEPHDSTPEQARAADFLKSCMADMSESWNDVISEILTMLTYGHAFMECIYKMRRGSSNNPKLKSRFNDGLIGWRKIALRSQSTLHDWMFDDAGGIQGMVQQAPPDYKIREIPIGKSLLFRTTAINNNPEGRSILRSAYRSWYMLKNLEEIEAIGIERDLVGLPKFTPPEGFNIDAPENEETRKSVNKIISSLRRDEQEGICLPSGGWTLELLTIGGSRRQFDTNLIIGRYGKRIALSVLAQFIMLGMDRVGSFALAKTGNDLFLTAVQGYLDAIAEVLNRFEIPRLFSFNPQFVALAGRFPILIPGKVVDPNLTDLATYISSLAKDGFMIADDDIRRELRRIGGISEPHERRLGEVRIDTPPKANGNSNRNKTKAKDKNRIAPPDGDDDNKHI